MEISNITGQKYKLSDCVRIVDQKQQKLYIKNDVYPIDMFTTKDMYSDNQILVMLFNKEETKDLYIKWKNRELE